MRPWLLLTLSGEGGGGDTEQGGCGAAHLSAPHLSSHLFTTIHPSSKLTQFQMPQLSSVSSPDTHGGGHRSEEELPVRCPVVQIVLTAKAILARACDPFRISPGPHCLSLTTLRYQEILGRTWAPPTHSFHQQSSMLPLQSKFQYKSPGLPPPATRLPP